MNCIEAYQILGIPQGSSVEQVKKAFRQQAKMCHPDMGGDPVRFRLIKEAYELLRTMSVPRLRRLPLTHSRGSILRIVPQRVQ